jgi:hypothetical protein
MVNANPGKSAMVNALRVMVSVSRSAVMESRQVSASPGRVMVSRENVLRDRRAMVIASLGTRTATGQIPRGALAPREAALIVLVATTTSTR